MLWLAFTPNKAQLFLVLGLLPLLLWLPRRLLGRRCRKTRPRRLMRGSGHGLEPQRRRRRSGAGFLLCQNRPHPKSHRRDQSRDNVRKPYGENCLFRHSLGREPKAWQIYRHGGSLHWLSPQWSSARRSAHLCWKNSPMWASENTRASSSRWSARFMFCAACRCSISYKARSRQA